MWSCHNSKTEVSRLAPSIIILSVYIYHILPSRDSALKCLIIQLQLNHAVDFAPRMWAYNYIPKSEFTD